jgi:2-iminoacetate synthase
MMKTAYNVKNWIAERIRPEEIEKYLDNGRDFMDHDLIESCLEPKPAPNRAQLQDILDKSLSVTTLLPEDTAALLRVEDPDHLALMQETALEVKKKVYDNRIVTFAPLYMSDLCVNNCLYCGFRSDNENITRRQLSMDEVAKEVEVLAGQIGHKRLIVVYGEHPKSGVDYIAETISTVYGLKFPTRKGYGSIRRVNVNAAPLQVDELRQLREVGIGTFQVFQETYHRPTYEYVHPANTLKGNYLWRLYCMHRAMEAGVDDVGIGVLFGLYEWKYEVMALLLHSRELEAKFGIGPHTISFPRIEPAENTPYASKPKRKVDDADFLKLVSILRLSVPHTGMIVTCREGARLKDKCLEIGCTQTDSSSQIGIGGYSELGSVQESKRQQFMLGDTRSLDEMIHDLAKKGCITSFCTAGYRCGRTGKCIMDMLRSGHEGKFCKLNAVITYREWLDDFASEETRLAGEKVIQEEIRQIKETMPKAFPQFMENYNRTVNGERDIYF